MGVKRNGEAPCTQTWKLWRHCCCRYGWYSLLIMPVITSGCLLSLYSSFGCDFVDLEVGFTPSNEAWNQSSAHLGLFTMYTGQEGGGNKYAETALMDGCEWYPSDFENNFVEGDRTWKVARIMALISGVASITATLTSWLFLFTPLPASFFWPGLLLPAVLVAFLAEGSKFLMFDTAVCRTALWTPEGVDSLAQKAESCSLGSTAVYTIISGCIFFVALMFVCLKAPEKRLLDEHYGRRYDDDNNMHHQYPNNNHEQGELDDVESALSGADFASQGSYPRGRDVYIVADSTSHADHSLNDMESVSGRSDRSRRSRGSGRHRSSNPRPAQELTTVRSESSGGARSDGSSYHGSRDGRESKSARRFPEDSRDDVADAANPTTTSKQLNDAITQEERISGGFDDRMSAAEIAIRRSEQQRISESRVSKIEEMELSSTSESNDLIEKFVSDLDLSFRQEEIDKSGHLDMPSSQQTQLGKATHET